ncbi:MAG: DUF6398 domain-containing protein [Solirubrobacterales bacterium]
MADELRMPTVVRAPASAIIDITDAVCRDHLDEEYGRMARRLVARLARKRPSPLLRGDARIWAAGVLYAIGRINFLFDPSQRPHLSAAQLAAAVGAKQTTMANGVHDRPPGRERVRGGPRHASSRSRPSRSR